MNSRLIDNTKYLKNMIYVGTAMTAAGVSFGNFFANPEVGQNTGDIFSAAGAASDSLVTSIVNLYTQKLFWPLFLVNLILLAFTKNEKKLEVYKKSLWVIAIVYVLCKCQGIIVGTLDALLNSAGVAQ